MAERLHPGIYLEERRRGVAPIQGVSTSNFGIAGFTERGPVDEAVLVTSFEQFSQTFGDFTEDSQVPTQVYAFFANGGRRAYVVRAVAADAVAADGFLTNPVSEEAIETGDGVVKAFAGTLAHLPVEPGTVAITYQEAGTPVAAQDLTANVTPARDGVVLDFAGRIVVAGNAAIVPGTVTITYSFLGPTVGTLTDPGKAGVLVDSGGNTRGYVDYKTGAFSISLETGEEPLLAEPFTVGYTPVGATRTVVDDGAGALTGATLTAPGTIDYTTGAYSFTVAVGSAAPHDQCSVLAAYTQNAFDIDPISRGAWGNGVRVDVRGNEDGFTRSSATYALHDVLVYLDGSLKETFSGVVFGNAADPDYVITALNDENTGSDLINLVSPANEAIVPDSLNGKQRIRALGSGNGVLTQFGSTAAADADGYPEIPVTHRSVALEGPIQPGSISITYTGISGTARTITDDGNGNLTGDVNPAAPTGYNQVDYTTGKFAVQTVEAVQVAETSNLAVPTGAVPGSLLRVTYRKTPSATLLQHTLSGGSDGVAGLTRSELTNPTLLATRRGVYALLREDELMNVALPDAAGSTTMLTDLITEAERNGKWFIIMAPPAGMTPTQVKDWRRNTLGISSSYGALYWPYIRIQDPVTDRAKNIPAAGHIAGVYARTDTNKSVGKAPAGTDDGRLNFSVGLEYKVEFAEIDTFFQSQVNALVDTPQTGRCVWGARTLENPPDDFRFVHIRRLFNFLKASIFNATHGFVFENVGASLRQRIQLTAENFLRTLFNQGLFAGSTPDEAFVVVCDETNNSSQDEENGTVICDVYVAPNKPGEFIVFRLQQKFSNT